ncbi:MAG: tetratricopeptide repeat protein [Deltaproteobacteria bacterium]|nr:tetratricopeptide repeat protein [Deltaproteobacteria bacterium]
MYKFILGFVVLVVLTSCGGSGETAEKYMQAGFIYFQKQEYDQAIASFQKAVELEPKAAAGHNMLGMAYRFKATQLGIPELRAKEIAAFQKALEADPKYWVAMINLGVTYFGQGEKAKAAPLLKKAVALNPQHPEKDQLEKMIAEGEAKP